MSVRAVSPLAALASLALLAVPDGAGADEVALTPEGPATIAGVWTGVSTAEGRPPQVAVGWTVTVGPGGRGGPVRLQAITTGASRRVVGGGPVEQLPATPGTYRFTLPAGKGLRIGDYRSVSPAIAQATGGHAILVRPAPTPERGPFADLAQLWHTDVFTPAPADDAQDVTPSQALPGTRLAVEMATEYDVDQDGLGDQTQDVGDLKVLSARVGQREGTKVEVVAHVRNAGTTVRDRATIDQDGIPRWVCAGPACGVQEIAAGQEADLRTVVDAAHGEPTQVTVSAEGPDLTPADNTLALPPRVGLSAPDSAGSPAGGIRIRVGLGRAGTVKLAARAAGLGFGRTLSFASAGRKTILLAPKKKADRRRLARALRRPGKLAALVTADSGNGPQALRLKL